MTLEAQLQQRLLERQQLALYRQRQTIQGAQGPEVSLNGTRYLNFCSNDYLGLANHPKLIEAANNALQKYGTGSGASHLVCGHSDVHQQLELELAQWTRRSRALLFSTGYMANLGVITALLGRSDQVFQDRLNHASLLDGGLLSGAKMQRFKHNDIEDLQTRLEAKTKGNALVAVDGVFSMDGDLAPLPQMAEVAAQHQAWLMVDDAHGLGVLGDQGAGICNHFNLGEQQVPVLMGTLGKAVGSFGAFVAGSEALIEALIQFARPYIYTTALPPAVAAASLASVQLIRANEPLRERLQGLIRYFRQGLEQLALPPSSSTTAIQPLLLGDEQRALAWSNSLKEQGIWVAAIRPPTVPKGTSRLRITLSAAHSKDHIDQLLSALSRCKTQVV